MAVVARPGEPVGNVLRRFGRLVDRAGLLKDLKMHRFALTRAERRRLKAQRAARRREKGIGAPRAR